MNDVGYGNRPETVLRAKPKTSGKETNHVLLGTWLKIQSTQGDWLEVETAGRGPGGWVHKSDVRETPILKVFFVDVGQGDGAIIESPTGNLLIDGGPNKGFHSFLRNLYGPTIDSGKKIHFDALIMSHPDYDHFNGLTRVLLDDDFTFGTIYHNGIIRYDDRKPAGKPFDLGKLTESDGRTVLIETFDTLDQAQALVDGGNLLSSYAGFWKAAEKARAAGRLTGAKRLTSREEGLLRFRSEGEGKLRVEVLGPVPTSQNGKVKYVTFADPHDFPSTTPSSSHTRNGHSIVLKLTFGDHTFFFGGDLNIPAEKHLMATYGAANPFRVDVAKACHHGSSDFTVDFLKQARPLVNVFSSGQPADTPAVTIRFCSPPRSPGLKRVMESTTG
ncbi:MAG: hypothetical protein P8Z70_13375 [Desulfuromonadales bacterium]